MMMRMRMNQPFLQRICILSSSPRCSAPGCSFARRLGTKVKSDQIRIRGTGRKGKGSTLLGKTRQGQATVSFQAGRKPPQTLGRERKGKEMRRPGPRGIRWCSCYRSHCYDDGLGCLPKFAAKGGGSYQLDLDGGGVASAQCLLEWACGERGGRQASRRRGSFSEAGLEAGCAQPPFPPASWAWRAGGRMKAKAPHFGPAGRHVAGAAQGRPKEQTPQDCPPGGGRAKHEAKPQRQLSPPPRRLTCQCY